MNFSHRVSGIRHGTMFMGSPAASHGRYP
jgi:hypothetical protein